jgi:hypothetical protein
MVNESNFIVRSSARKANSFYIDYLGSYKVSEIAKISGLEPVTVKEIYIKNDAVYDASLDVYYFGKEAGAKSSVSEICSKIDTDKKGKLIFLSDDEIALVRKALINESSSYVHFSSEVIDSIFKKLND